MDSGKNEHLKDVETTSIQDTLRYPIQIVKKPSGPLDDILAKLNESENKNDTRTTTNITTQTCSKMKNDSKVLCAQSTVAITKPTTVTRPSPTASRRRSTLKDKDKKRERWLLTRKTWKYMTDAGRKLIPDGAQNCPEDLPKIEAYFQKVCASETHFVSLRRKSSYPGAMRNSKKRLKQLLQHTGLKSQQVLEHEENNADKILKLLHNHLKLDEAVKTDTLLGTKTEGPHQTNSPSAQRPKLLARSLQRSDLMTASLRGPGFLPSSIDPSRQVSEVEQLLQSLTALSKSSSMPKSIQILPDQVNAELLNDKTTLKKIYHALKKQQLHRVLSNHSMPSKPGLNLTHSRSTMSLLNFGSSYTKVKSNTNDSKNLKTRGPIETSDTSLNISTNASTHNTNNRKTEMIHRDIPAHPVIPQRQSKPTKSLNLSSNSIVSSDHKNQHRRHIVPEKEFNSCGTQTNFIPLSEIKRLAKEYKEYKQEEAAADARGCGNATTDDEAEKQTSDSYRRKSSIDNEDVSQSVSDTIKRYLRMARKKSVHDDNANRFRRVNYDRILRNIRQKGEINPPGMDEDDNKAVQTLDAWALITLDFIRGNENSGVLQTAHNDWKKALDERVQRKLKYEQLLNQSENEQQPREITYTSTSISASSSAPTSPTSPTLIQLPTVTNRTSTSSSGLTFDVRPTEGNIHIATTTGGVSGSGSTENTSNVGGIFHSGSKFLTNFWHGTTSSSSHSPSSPSFAASKHIQLSPTAHIDGIDVNSGSKNCLDMQKSKSSSHVSQYASSKILKVHPKNQNKFSESASLNTLNTTAKVPKWSRLGKCLWSSETGDLILLADVAFHVLSDLEAKTVQKLCLEKITELNIGINSIGLLEDKSQKRRLLARKRAMTISFFDIGKKDSNITDSNISLFGNSLEGCVVNDKKRELSNLRSYDRRSRNSVVSLFRVRSSRGCAKNVNNFHKLNDNVRSYESLPIGSVDNANTKTNTKSSFLGNYFGNIAKSSSTRLSRSQSDVRRGSHESSELISLTPDNVDGATNYHILKELQVPKFVTSCIHFLEQNGLHKVGLFRVSTSKKRVKQLRDSLEKNMDIAFEVDTCPYNVATLLKEFLRDLPNPLLSNNLYNAFLETQKIRNRRLQLEAISHLVKLLPTAHRDTLYVLLKFLAKVAACSDDIDINNGDGTVHLTGNKMDSNNLATVFAPNILRLNVNNKSSSPSSRDHLQTLKEQDSISDAINVIRIMIDHYEELFQVSAEVLDVVYSQLLDEAPEQLYNICEYHKTALENCIQSYEDN